MSQGLASSTRHRPISALPVPQPTHKSSGGLDVRGACVHAGPQPAPCSLIDPAATAAATAPELPAGSGSAPKPLLAARPPWQPALHWLPGAMPVAPGQSVRLHAQHNGVALGFGVDPRDAYYTSLVGPGHGSGLMHWRCMMFPT